MKEIKVTKKGLQALKDELEELKSVTRQEIAEKIKVALSFGDLSENSEYDEAKNNQAVVEGRIVELENMIKNCVVLDSSNIQTDTVKVGLEVKVKNLKRDKEAVYTIVSTAEADSANGKISDESPMGKALLGAKKGETVAFMAPAGEISLQVVDIFVPEEK